MLCWLLDTGEALLGAGAPALPETHYFGVAASWSFPWLRCAPGSGHGSEPARLCSSPRWRVWMPARCSDRLVHGPILFLPRRLLGHVMTGAQWRPEAHPFYPSTFRAAARMAALVNGTCGFGGARRPRRSPRRSAAAGSAVGVTLPAEVLQRILGLAASPLSLWVGMMPSDDF